MSPCPRHPSRQIRAEPHRQGSLWEHIVAAPLLAKNRRRSSTLPCPAMRWKQNSRSTRLSALAPSPIHHSPRHFRFSRIPRAAATGEKFPNEFNRGASRAARAARPRALAVLASSPRPTTASRATRRTQCQGTGSEAASLPGSASVRTDGRPAQKRTLSTGAGRARRRLSTTDAASCPRGDDSTSTGTARPPTLPTEPSMRPVCTVSAPCLCNPRQATAPLTAGCEASSRRSHSLLSKTLGKSHHYLGDLLPSAKRVAAQGICGKE
jgi:hypothetical protein